MWKSFLNGLLESFVASDPAVYMYWRCTTHSSVLKAEAADVQTEPRPEASHARPLDAARSRSEVPA